jgi:hypothetical protein
VRCYIARRTKPFNIYPFDIKHMNVDVGISIVRQLNDQSHLNTLCNVEIAEILTAIEIDLLQDNSIVFLVTCATDVHSRS